jgi:hypothetical protein
MGGTLDPTTLYRGLLYFPTTANNLSFQAGHIFFLAIF